MEKKLEKVNLVRIDPTEAIDLMLQKRLAEVDPAKDLVLIKGRKKEKIFRGERGDSGPIPRHQWIGTSLQFENPDGSFDPPIDLKGDRGEKGDRGNDGLNGRMGPMPAHEFLDGKIRFQTPEGWSKWYDVRGDRGIEGPQGLRGPQGDRGPSGPVPEHEREGQLLRFRKPNGEWGDWIDLGTQSFAGFLNPRGGGGAGGQAYIGTIAAGETKIVISTNATNFFNFSLKSYFQNADKSSTKMFDVNAILEGGDVNYTVFGKVGTLDVTSEAVLVGGLVQYKVTNNEAFEVKYRVVDTAI